MVDFEMLFKLSQDGQHGVEFADIIHVLECQEIKMSPEVREFGKLLGVLYN